MVAVSEGVVLEGEEAHITGKVQLHPGGRVRSLIGGEPVLWAPLPPPLDHIPWPAL